VHGDFDQLRLVFTEIGGYYLVPESLN